MTFPEYVPLAVRVTVVVVLLPGATGDGVGTVMATAGAGTPVPLNEMTCGLSGASSVTVMVPVRCPVVVGVKTTEISHVLPTSKKSRLVVQVLVEEKSPLAVIEEMPRRAKPLLERLMYCVELEVPTATLPKEREEEEGVAAAG